MKILVIYFSRTGNTKKVGGELAAALSADVEEIIDTANRSGPIGFIRCASEGNRRMLAKIQPVKKDAAEYDVIVIGSPNWDANMSSPVRTYLTENKAKFKSVAFFLTEGVRGGSERAFAEMEEVAGKKPKATLTVPVTALKSGSYVDKLKKFADDVKA